MELAAGKGDDDKGQKVKFAFALSDDRIILDSESGLPADKCNNDFCKADTSSKQKINYLKDGGPEFEAVKVTNLALGLLDPALKYDDDKMTKLNAFWVDTSSNEVSTLKKVSVVGIAPKSTFLKSLNQNYKGKGDKTIAVWLGASLKGNIADENPLKDPKMYFGSPPDDKFDLKPVTLETGRTTWGYNKITAQFGDKDPILKDIGGCFQFGLGKVFGLKDQATADKILKNFIEAACVAGGESKDCTFNKIPEGPSFIFKFGGVTVSLKPNQFVEYDKNAEQLKLNYKEVNQYNCEKDDSVIMSEMFLAS